MPNRQWYHTDVPVILSNTTLTNSIVNYRSTAIMRLLNCIHSIDPRGGGPADFVRQCAALQESHSFQMEVACLDSGDSDFVQSFPSKVHAFGPSPGTYGFNLRFLSWIQEHAIDYDAIIVDGLWQFVSVGTWIGAAKTRTPYFVFPHGMLDPWFNEAYPLKRIKKAIYWKLFEHRVLRDARAVFFTSKDERDRSSQSFAPYLANDQIVPYGTMPPPIDRTQEADAYKAQYKPDSNSLFILYLARLHPKKGCDMLIDAVKNLSTQHPQIQLVLAGPSDERYLGQLESRAESCPSIHFLPMISGIAKWSLLTAADALILPSHQENFARAVSEALSCSTPVLLSDKVNIAEQVAADGAGIVEPDSPDGTKRLIERFLALSSEERTVMRKKAYECFERRYNLNKNFEEYLALIRKLKSGT